MRVVLGAWVPWLSVGSVGSSPCVVMSREPAAGVFLHVMGVLVWGGGGDNSLHSGRRHES